ncbi:MAG: histidine kinase [Terriglobales bacterium]
MASASLPRSARVLIALEQLLLPRPEAPGAGLEGWWEQVRYCAARLAKLGIRLAQVNEALAMFRPLAEKRLRRRFGERAAVAMEAWFQQQTALAVAEAFVASQSTAVDALLAVLDAELGAAGQAELLQKLLQQAAQLFPLRWGEVLLLDRQRLRHAASYGLRPGMIQHAAGVGQFFQRVLERRTPGFLLDAANDPRVAQPYFRALEVKSVWAVPLLAPQRAGAGAAEARPAEVLGVLTLAFDRVYECLPQERDLLLALAERSSLAIERTRMLERLAREQARVTELSRRLLDAHDEERRRISRDLHDETGQALLALRLYLEMGLRQGERTEIRRWLRKGVALVDSSVAELRRILAQLSPLLLDELGLEPALRLELRRLRLQQRWRTRFQFAAGPERLDRGLEILIYRVVLEGLRNIARHARAQRVWLRIAVADGRVGILLRDDGVGLPAGGGERVIAGHFGLVGMRERVRLAGGALQLSSAPGQGVSLQLELPLKTPPAALAAHAG